MLHRHPSFAELKEISLHSALAELVEKLGKVCGLYSPKSLGLQQLGQLANRATARCIRPRWVSVYGRVAGWAGAKSHTDERWNVENPAYQ